MGRYAKETGGGDFQQAPVGNHVGRTFRIVDIGTHHSEWQGKPVTRNQFILFIELPNELMETDEGAKPFIVTKFYTNSLSEKANLRHDLEAWRGRTFTQEELENFDLMNILDKPCMVSIVKAENGKSKVSSLAAMPKGITCPPASNEISAFWMDEFDRAKFEAMSEGLKKLIMKSDEYIEMTTGGAKTKAQEALELMKVKKFYDIVDDIPF